VYLGNNRAVFDMGHRYLKRSDPRFWGKSSRSSTAPFYALTWDMKDYNIRELALYDLPALVDHVRNETGYDKVRRTFLDLSTRISLMLCRADCFYWTFTRQCHNVLLTGFGPFCEPRAITQG
jgi:lysosomal acid lipase/cholesteryl ester hydrolase